MLSLSLPGCRWKERQFHEAFRGDRRPAVGGHDPGSRRCGVVATREFGMGAAASHPGRTKPIAERAAAGTNDISPRTLCSLAARRKAARFAWLAGTVRRSVPVFSGDPPLQGLVRRPKPVF